MSISGRRLDQVVLNPDGMRGFPFVLQQISKILSYPLMQTGLAKSGKLLYSAPLPFLGWNNGSADIFLPCLPFHVFSTETLEERGGGAPRSSISELLQMCWPSLTEDCVASHTSLSQQLEQALQSLREALALPGTGLSAQEQISRKEQQEREMRQPRMCERFGAEVLPSRAGLSQPFPAKQGTSQNHTSFFPNSVERTLDTLTSRYFFFFTPGEKHTQLVQH